MYVNAAFLLLLQVHFYRTDGIETSEEDFCNKHVTCSECLRFPNCSWCTKEDFIPFRCGTRSYLTKHGCGPLDSELPESSNSILKKEDTTQDSGALLNPVYVEADLSVAIPMNITLKVHTKFPPGQHTKNTTIEVKSKGDTSDIEVRFFSSCKGINVTETNKCDFIMDDDKVEFKVQLSLKSCKKKPSEWKTDLSVYPEGFKSLLKIAVTLKCGCECEKKIYGAVVRSEKCSYNGNFSCGMCTCDSGFFGKFCQCNREKELDPWKMHCRKSLTDVSLCSGRGQCSCDGCYCDVRTNPEERVYGQYCECDNFSCDRYNSEICGGPDNGECNCGKCFCKEGWSGTACEITDSTDGCIGIDGNICSNNGICQNGHCVCFDGVGHGAFCDVMQFQSCDAYKSCVECRVFQSGPLTSDRCLKDCENISIHIVEELQTTNDEVLCQYIDHDSCYFYFTYLSTEINVVKVQRTKACPRNNLTSKPQINTTITQSPTPGGVSSLRLHYHNYVWTFLTMILIILTIK
ncbi:integrin beta-PS-like [Limulus polyphemus]|uniref:Integrin beta-PS-like n=1 Tax=Limulus polyphemus TaxID=6850 RepID=A0ABM1SDF7_LIMPO|nr:integrin beta-PS-like [Limulus polyphemus]